MAMTPEDKVARGLTRLFDSIDLDTRLAARFTVGNMSHLMQSKFFDFLVYCIAEFHRQGEDQGYRSEVIRGMYEGAEKAGFQLEQYDSYPD